MASAEIQRSTASNGNSGKLTVSFWVKRGDVGREQYITTMYYSGAYHGVIYFSSSDTLNFYDYRNGYIMRKITNAKFTDCGAWYHVVCNFDHTIGSPTAKIYVNGVQQSLGTDVNYSQGATTSWLTDYTHQIGHFNGGQNFNGILADYYFIQGYLYEASTFGETDATTGEWKPIIDPTINYSGTGGNSCRLKFEDSSNMDLDSGSNTVTFTTSGTVTQTQDCPSHNFCTLNPMQRSRVNTNNSGDYLTNAATTFDTSSTNGMKAIVNGTIGVQSGKWYWEAKVITNTRMQIGISTGIEQKFPQPYYDETEYTAITMDASGDVKGRYTGSAIDQFSSSTSNTTNDVLGFALDMDNKALYIHKNGTYLSNGSNTGVPTSGSSRTGSMIEGLAGSRDDYFPTGEFMFPVIMDVSTSGVAKVEFNFGNGFFGSTAISSEGTNASGIGKFEYDVPAGYTALSTKGLNE